MESKDYLAYLVEEIHTTVVATVDDAGLPVTAAIDMMDADEGGVYFLTARGKGFYDRLKKRGVLALTGMKGEDTMHCAALSIRGKVRELESELLPRLFEKNPYMNEIYPDAERSAVIVMVRTEILEAVCIFLLVRYDLDLRQNPADCLWHLRGKSYHIFFHPDYTVGPGITPDQRLHQQPVAGLWQCHLPPVGNCTPP